MTFCEATDRAHALKGRCLPGLDALEATHRRQINAPSATGSIDIDKALETAGLTEAHRYDYGIGLPPDGKSRRDRAVWVEVHGATTKEISRMLAKRQALRDWLNTSAPELLMMSVAYLWVPTGKVDIPENNRRRLAQQGLRLCPGPCTLR